MARFAFNALYRMLRTDARRDEVVFISRQIDDPSYDFAELARRLEERGWKTTMHLKKVTRRNMASYARHVLVEIKLLGRCKAAVVDRYDPVVCLIDFECDPPPSDSRADLVNLDFPRRPVILQLWHAFGAFKMFGFQYVDTPEGHPSDFMADWRIHRNYSWVACSGEGARPAFVEAFSCPMERIVALRRPEYDELRSLRDIQASRKLEFDSSKRSPRVLMAPTLRKSAEVAHPFRDLYGWHERFERELDAQLVWAFHPLESGLPAPGNVSEELLECDIVVTDYSSIVYEAYLLGKPVLFYIPDIESFRITPGLNRDPLIESPGLCARDSNDLASKLNAFAANPATYPRNELDRFIGAAFDAAADPVDFLLSKVTDAYSPSN